ncbi:MAG: hypothetical protein GEU28_02745 [Dehalococcoidia bacterium]|nr:hypothetical protein [Dehalococcoidia bacterium]
MVSEDTVQQVRSYVKGQAERHPLPDLVTRVRATYDELSALVRDMTPEQAAFRGNPDDWTLQEVMGHVATYTPNVRWVMGELDAGRNVAYPRRNLGEPPLSHLSVQEAADTALTALTEIDEAFRGREPNIETYTAHPTFGEMNAKEWVLFLRVHTNDHVDQVRAAVAHPDYPAGPG